MMLQKDDIFRAFADPSRRRIMEILWGGPRHAGDLARAVRLAPNAVSFHLKWLRSAGLIASERQGRYLRYHANRPTVEAWLADVQLAFPRLEGSGPAAPTRGPGSRRTPRKGRRTPAVSPPAEPPGIDEFGSTLPTELL